MPRGVAEQVNELVAWGVDYFQKHLTEQLKYLMGSGYPPLTERPANPEEELMQLTPMLGEALATAMDEAQLPGIRDQARDVLIRWMQLSQIVGQRNAERTAPA